jgi:Mrp family chromosome partitioning ATPase
MIKKFMNDVIWNDLDYLLIDSPPGTSDEHLAVLENIRQIKESVNVSAVLVTTPQALSVNDVRREITFCKKTGIKIEGIIENMSGFICPHCDECSYLFTKHGGKMLAESTKCRFLGIIPLDPNLTKAIDQGEDFSKNMQNSKTLEYINEITNAIIEVN